MSFSLLNIFFTKNSNASNRKYNNIFEITELIIGEFCFQVAQICVFEYNFK